MDDQEALDRWYRYAAEADGFIGKALARQRERTQTTIAQQRDALGMAHPCYDHFWLHLQAMHLPREDHRETDLERIVSYLLKREGIAENPVNVAQLTVLLDA